MINLYPSVLKPWFKSLLFNVLVKLLLWATVYYSIKWIKGVSASFRYVNAMQDSFNVFDSLAYIKCSESNLNIIIKI